MKEKEFCEKEKLYPDAVIFSIFDNTKVWIFSGKYFWEYDLKKESLLNVANISDTFENLTTNIDAAFLYSIPESKTIDFIKV